MTTSGPRPGETRFGESDEEAPPVTPPEDAATTRIEDTADAAGFRERGVDPTIAMPRPAETGGGFGAPAEPAGFGEPAAQRADAAVDEPGYASESVQLTEPTVVVEPLGAEPGVPPEPEVPAEAGLAAEAAVAPTAAVGTDAGVLGAAGTPQRPAEPPIATDVSAVDQARDRGRAALAVLADFARRRPAAFLVAAAVAGVVASRVLGGRRNGG
jgi:hypothetical protein